MKIFKHKNLFLTGFICHAAIINLIQDLYGKEQWSKIVDVVWIFGWVTIPIEIFLLICVLLVFISYHKQPYETNEPDETGDKKN